MFELLGDPNDAMACVEDSVGRSLREGGAAGAPTLPAVPRPPSNSSQISTRANPQAQTEFDPGARVGIAQTRELRRFETSINFLAEATM